MSRSALPIIGHNRLSVASWADDGVPEGVTQGKPAQIAFVDGWNLKPDLIVEKSDTQEHKSGIGDFSSMWT